MKFKELKETSQAQWSEVSVGKMKVPLIFISLVFASRLKQWANTFYTFFMIISLHNYRECTKTITQVYAQLNKMQAFFHNYAYSSFPGK